MRRLYRAEMPFPRAQSRAFLCRFAGIRAQKGALPLTQRKIKAVKTQLLLFSDPPRRWFYFDYDPGPLFCVHLQKIHVPGAFKCPDAAHHSMFFFIIAPQKNGVNPKPWIYRNFYFITDKIKILLAHPSFKMPLRFGIGHLQRRSCLFAARQSQRALPSCFFYGRGKNILPKAKHPFQRCGTLKRVFCLDIALV